jgi:hypothetical protein
MNQDHQIIIQLNNNQVDANTDNFHLFLVFFVIYVYVLTRILT